MQNHDRFIELRSEEVQELLTQQPTWFLRWSTLILLLVLLVVLYCSWVIRFPDVLTASFTLTSINAPSTSLAPVSGKIIRLLVHDGQAVSAGTPLAFLESTAQHRQVLKLSQELRRGWSLANRGQLEQISRLNLGRYHDLGELQTAYQEFTQNYVQLQSYLSHGFYSQEKVILQQELSDLIALESNLRQQLSLQKMEMQLAEEEFRTQQRLAHDKVIAAMELKREESKLTARKIPYQQSVAALITNSVAQRSKQKDLLELDKRVYEQRENFLQALNTLQSAVAAWETKYIIRASNHGYAHFPRRLQENQQVEAGQELFYLVPYNTAYLGEIKIPQQNAGAVRVGQAVLVRFASYPYQEYGVVKGTIKSIAQIPIKDGQFLASVALPAGLTSSNGNPLTYKMGMVGSADIITKDKRLLHRIFYQFGLLFQRGSER